MLENPASVSDCWSGSYFVTCKLLIFGMAGSWFILSSVFVVLLSALVLAIITLENTKYKGEVVEYSSKGWMRESVVWDEENQRFLVSNMEGGVGEIRLQDGGGLREETVVKDLEFLGNCTLGLQIDTIRNRLLVVIADSYGLGYSALAAYDLKTWKRLYFTKLCGPESTTHANAVDLDPEGNAYVTDTKQNIIWKVSSDGSTVSVLRNPVFASQSSKVPFMAMGLNGIVYHPDGFLLVVHMCSGAIIKSSLDGVDVSVVNMSSPMVLGDGLVLLSPEKMAVVGTPSARLLESRDGWKSAQLTHRYVGPMHRFATAGTIKNGKVFVSHMFGFGFGNGKHIITEAIFRPLGVPNRSCLF